jgi:hypothetical protein
VHFVQGLGSSPALFFFDVSITTVEMQALPVQTIAPFPAVITTLAVKPTPTAIAYYWRKHNANRIQGAKEKMKASERLESVPPPFKLADYKHILEWEPPVRVFKSEMKHKVFGRGRMFLVGSGDAEEESERRL